MKKVEKFQVGSLVIYAYRTRLDDVMYALIIGKKLNRLTMLWSHGDISEFTIETFEQVLNTEGYWHVEVVPS